MDIYAQQAVLDEEVKASFWEALDEVVRSVPSSDKIVIAGDFNDHIGVLPGGYDDVYGGFSFDDRNGEGAALLEFARAFGLAGRHKGDWWWNEKVKKKMESKKRVYVKFIESKDEEEKRVNREV
ncbi:uncharacterized protein LOC124887772 [Capsicum annuum]|uniref:uncharacterized protein LOC124887772 n=1 Tax=Capsicum annuum TaxID=4072 RepID=UPI001FB0EEF8|nr:uncharacterized protein LOC124887772 [Capsicum annuum]